MKMGRRVGTRTLGPWNSMELVAGASEAAAADAGRARAARRGAASSTSVALPAPPPARATSDWMKRGGSPGARRRTFDGVFTEPWASPSPAGGASEPCRRPAAEPGRAAPPEPAWALPWLAGPHPPPRDFPREEGYPDAKELARAVLAAVGPEPPAPEPPPPPPPPPPPAPRQRQSSPVRPAGIRRHATFPVRVRLSDWNERKLLPFLPRPSLQTV